MVEIERKFLVDNPAQALLSARHSFHIFQGYISNDPARTRSPTHWGRQGVLDYQRGIFGRGHHPLRMGARNTLSGSKSIDAFVPAWPYPKDKAPRC